MKLRQALIEQSPSLALQRAAQIEIAKLDAEIAALKKLIETNQNKEVDHRQTDLFKDQ